MPLLRTLTTKLKIAISPSPSPTQSPTSPSFHVVSGRKQSSSNSSSSTRSLIHPQRPSDAHMRNDSFLETGEEKVLTKMTTRGSSSEAEGDGERKKRRISRFREELDGDLDLGGL